MNSVASRPLAARALAILLTVLLAVAGFALPAYAETDPTVPVPAPVEVPTVPLEETEAATPAEDDTPADEVATAPEEEPVGEDLPVEEQSIALDALAAETPELTVSKTTGLDASGETVTVSGSGYNPAQAMYLIVCRDVPLEDVSFAFASACTGGAKMITPNPTTPTMVQLEADGSFTTTFSVSKSASFTASAIYTVANHTAMDDRTQDAKQSISFTPLLSVTPATGLSTAGATVTVTGSGYNPAQPMYLVFCRDVPVSTVTFTMATSCMGGAKQITPNPTTPTMVKLEADGTFTTTMTVSPNAAHTSGSAFFTLANHSAMGDRTQDARRAVTFAAPTATATTITAPASAVAGTDVAVEVAVSPVAAGSVTLSGAGLADQTVAVDGSGKASFVLADVEAGSHTLTADFAPTDALVFAPSTRTAPLEVTAPARVPTLTVSKTARLDAAGETVTVTGSGYNPAQPMYLLICRDVPLSEVDFAFAAGCTAGSKQITPNPTTPTMVKLEADGTFTTTFTISRNPAHASGSAIYTVANHTAMNDRSQDAKQAVSFTPLLTVTPATGLDPSGETVTVTGSGYNPAQPMYLIYCRQAPLSEVDFAFAAGCTAGSKQITPNPTTPTMVKLEADGTFSTTFTIAANANFTSGGAIYTVANHTAMNDRTQDARRLVSFAGASPTVTTASAPTITAGGVATIQVAVSPANPGTVRLTGAGDAQDRSVGSDGTATFTVSALTAGSYALTATFTPSNAAVYAPSTGTATLTVSAPAATRVGALSWGVKADFRAYVTGPIAQGSITTTGASSSGGVFGFTQTSGSLDGSGLGTAGYGGSVRFLGHHGALDLRISDPTVRVDSATSGVLLVRVNGGSPVEFASLALGSGSRSVADGVTTYSGVPATLTASGASAFSGFYGAGDALDAVSFSVGASGTVSGGTRTVGFTAPVTRTPAATAPATEGVSSQESTFSAGGTYTFTAEGFEPNETGILVVVYSTPTVLATDATADANGVVTWTGNLPAGLTGQHTFTFQGSVDRGLVIDIAAAEVVGCPVEKVELSWGFKESFRAYIDGSIANGEWTVADGATYETPLFGFTGSGGYDAETGDADLTFDGSVRFTGHGGVLDTTIANPRVVIDGDRAVLLLDITGTTQDGSAVSALGVEFAELDLAAAEQTGGGDLVAFTGIPAVLTAAGSAAFGTYEAGSELDPIDLSITVDPACAQPATDVEEPEATTAVENASDTSALLWIVLAVLVVLVAATAAILLVRRARRA